MLFLCFAAVFIIQFLQQENGCSFIYSGCERRIPGKVNLQPLPEPRTHGEKTMEEISVLEVGGKPKIINLKKTHAIRWGLKPQFT